MQLIKNETSKVVYDFQGLPEIKFDEEAEQTTKGILSFKFSKYDARNHFYYELTQIIYRPCEN
jgi:hypothetical protein